ncbi:MAG: VOC family protein [Pseudomonadota bacterium]
MAENDNPSIMHHVSVGVDDVTAAGEFYDAVLAPLGASRQFSEAFGIAYGKQFPEFWVQLPFDQASPTAGNGSHFAFIAPTRDAVDGFHRAGVSAGGTCDGPPGARPYTPDYYAAFLLDPWGNKIEAVHMSLG